MTATEPVSPLRTSFTGTFEAADPAGVDRWGGKGAGLARMSQSGLRVPPGFVISTEACRRYLSETAMPTGLADEVLSQLGALEGRAGKTFGRGPTPLLLSVRSGAPVSMPGMMDTILNLGLGREAAVALAATTSDTRFMADVVARFHAMYSEIVLGALDAEDGVREVVNLVATDDPAAETYDRVWDACERALHADSGESVPSDPTAQLLGAVEAVFRSWNTRRARTYRLHHGIPDNMGTAVVVQAMVFGNTGSDSGSGVVFTRNPVNGESGLFGEYLADCQGEDVVAGTRTPDPVAEALAPTLLAELTTTCADLETAQGDVLDIEFTVERSTLYFLQVRSAKRTPEAAVRIAADMLTDGTVSAATALSRVTPEQVRQVQRPGFDAVEVEQARVDGRVLTTGVGACPGQVSGMLVLESDRAKAASDDGTAVVLARAITSPADLHGMIAAQGIVTATGGSTSHAAVVARALGTTCVVGAAAMRIDPDRRTLTVGDRTIVEGDDVSLDGATGELFTGRFGTSTPVAATTALSTLVAASSEHSQCDVYGRVAVVSDLEEARAAGAAGVVCVLDEVLAAHGHLGVVLDRVLDHADADGPVPGVAELVAEALTPLLRAAGPLEVVVRAIDLISGPGRDLTDDDVSVRLPQAVVPLGLPGLVEAQLDGLAGALRNADSGVRAHLSIGRVSDPGEAKAIRELAAERDARLAVGACIDGPRGLHHAAAVAENGNGFWLDLEGLQAAAFGLPRAALSAPEPLDDYLRRGLLEVDPRAAVDPSVLALLQPLGGLAGDLGAHLSAPITPAIARALRELGVRRYAVDGSEVRPALLALAHAASR